MTTGYGKEVRLRLSTDVLTREGRDDGRALCQEYTMLGRDGRVLGWPATGIPQPNGSYYCGVGQEAVSAPMSPALSHLVCPTAWTDRKAPDRMC